MTNSTNKVPEDIVLQLRKELPKSRMSYGQARIVAQAQAIRLRTLLGTMPMRMPLDWVERIPGVSVTLLTASEMEELTKSPAASGATDVRKDGTYRVYINESNSITHCRFSLAHEVFHLINGPFEQDIFADFGHGDSDLHADRVERVADHFAANLLMPSSLVKKAWGYGIQGLSELAGQFGVSEDAMRIRLRSIGVVRSGLTKRMFYRRPRMARASAQNADWCRPKQTLQDGVRLFLRQISPPAAPDGGVDPAEEAPFGLLPEMRCPGHLLTVAEASQKLRVSKWMLNRLIQERQIKTFKLGSRRLIPETAVWALVNRLSDEEGEYGT